MRRLTDEERDRVAEYVPYARKIAAVYAARRNLGAHARDDIEATFLLALPFVVAEFDPTRGVSLSTHIHSRLAFRALDLLRFENGRPGKLSHRRRAETVSLDYPIAHDPDSVRALYVGDTIPDPRAARAAAEAEYADLLAALRKHVTSRELYVLVETFGAGRTLEDVGAEFGVGKNRAGQLRSRAVARLHAAGALEGR